MSSDEVFIGLFVLFGLGMAAAPWLPAFIYLEIQDKINKIKKAR